MLALFLSTLTLQHFNTHSYHFTCEYIDSTTTGQITRRRTIEADLIATPQEETWSNVTVAQAGAKPQSQLFMQGFRYTTADQKGPFTPGFFRNFPPTAIEEKNLVWDTIMFEHFAALSNRVKPGINTKFKSDEVKLGGSGTFTNSDVELTALGTAMLNGKRCKVMKYTALFNKVDVNAPGIHLLGRSHYWGEIWISGTNHHIVLGMLYEDVLGELTLGSSPAPRVINVFRIGTLRAVT